MIIEAATVMVVVEVVVGMVVVVVVVGGDGGGGCGCNCSVTDSGGSGEDHGGGMPEKSVLSGNTFQPLAVSISPRWPESNVPGKWGW